VNETAPVRGVERVAELSDRLCSLGRGKRAGSQPFPEVAALDVPHRDEQTLLCLTGFGDRDDVRVVEAGRELRLLEKPLPEALVLGEPG
jgi:hypothetical protein